MDNRRIDHPLGTDHPDNLGFGYIVEEGTEHSDNPFHLAPNGICPVCDQPHKRQIEQRHIDQRGFIYHCHQCGTDYFVRLFLDSKVSK